jgi:exonuclease VII small subunit
MPDRPVPADHQQAQETIAVALHDGLEYFGHETDDVTGHIAAVSDQAKKYERAMDALDALVDALTAAEKKRDAAVQDATYFRGRAVTAETALREAEAVIEIVADPMRTGKAEAKSYLVARAAVPAETDAETT